MTDTPCLVNSIRTKNAYEILNVFTGLATYKQIHISVHIHKHTQIPFMSMCVLYLQIYLYHMYYICVYKCLPNFLDLLSKCN